MANTDIVNSLKHGYELWASKDESAVPFFLSLMSDNVQWNSLANGCEGASFTQSRKGTSEVVQYFTDLVGEWELESYSADEFVSENDRIIMIGNCSFRHRGTGVLVETPKVDVFRHDGNKITEFMEYYDTHQLVCASRGN